MEGGRPPPMSLLPSTWLSAGRDGTAGLGGLCRATGLWVPSCTHRPAPEADALAPKGDATVSFERHLEQDWFWGKCEDVR